MYVFYRPGIIGVYVFYRPGIIGMYVFYRPGIIGVYVFYRPDIIGMHVFYRPDIIGMVDRLKNNWSISLSCIEDLSRCLKLHVWDAKRSWTGFLDDSSG